MTTPPRWAWSLLLVVYLLFAFIFSIIQPLGRTPDEAAHVTYAKFLAQNHRLPIFDAMGGGEAGYEAQHPPLYYAAMAVVYGLSGFLAENWRWHAMRWATILLLGLPMFVICRRFFTEALSKRGPCATADPDDHQDGCEVEDNAILPFIATASVMLMPLTLLYTGYINPDGAAMVFATLTLWLAWRLRLCAPNPRQAAILGIVAGLGALCKVSAAPALAIALLAHVRPRQGLRKGYRVAWADLGLTLAAFAVTAGWWYARNWYLYRSPLVHTTGMMGSGLEVAMRYSFWQFAWLTWRETYLSTWVQRGWFYGDFWNALLYGIIIAMTIMAIVGLIRNKCVTKSETGAASPTHLRSALNFSGLLLALVFIGHQWAYWTVDVEFNAGGRYILVAMMGLVLLLVVGVKCLTGRYSLPVLWAWVASLIVMNLVSMWNIWYMLNPRFAPGWQILNFPGS